jgi:hypothetical protein
MAMDSSERLTPAEDAELRRLHWFERLGCSLADSLSTIKESIRARDMRASIREPEVDVETYVTDDMITATATATATAALPRPTVSPEKRATVEQEGGYWVRVRRD